MTAYRSRKEELRYASHRKNETPDACAFCSASSGQEVSVTRYFRIQKNNFPYSMWDGLTVTDHVMVIPKKHIDSLSYFSESMAAEYFNIIKDYESQGYNIYARTPSSKRKTVVHQHTHMIKTSGSQKKFVLMLNRPYFRFLR